VRALGALLGGEAGNAETPFSCFLCPPGAMPVAYQYLPPLDEGRCAAPRPESTTAACPLRGARPSAVVVKAQSSPPDAPIGAHGRKRSLDCRARPWATDGHPCWTCRPAGATEMGGGRFVRGRLGWYVYVVPREPRRAASSVPSEPSSRDHRKQAGEHDGARCSDPTVPGATSAHPTPVSETLEAEASERCTQPYPR
jgi:hypothetical protein